MRRCLTAISLLLLLAMGSTALAAKPERAKPPKATAGADHLVGTPGAGNRPAPCKRCKKAEITRIEQAAHHSPSPSTI